jgi:hypothetical protein
MAKPARSEWPANSGVEAGADGGALGDASGALGAELAGTDAVVEEDGRKSGPRSSSSMPNQRRTTVTGQV